jgi:hypothetical protein
MHVFQHHHLCDQVDTGLPRFIEEGTMLYVVE